MKVPDLYVGKRLFCGFGNPVALGEVGQEIRGSAYIEGPLLVGAEKFAYGADSATLMLSNTINTDAIVPPLSILKIRSAIKATPIDVVMGDPTGPVGVSIYGGEQAPFTVVANAISMTTVKLLETSKTKNETAAIKNETGKKVRTGAESQTGVKHNLSVVIGSALQKIKAPVDCVDVKTDVTTLNATHKIAISKKSFDIPHPSKEGHRLRYICLEGPGADVYIRGQLKGENKIELPDYWKDLVDPESITVNLTPMGSYQELYYDMGPWSSSIIVMNSAGGAVNCSYTIYGTRKDVEKNIPEYEGTTSQDYPGDNSQYVINGGINNQNQV